jgi:hypothetical protein
MERGLKLLHVPRPHKPQDENGRCCCAWADPSSTVIAAAHRMILRNSDMMPPDVCSNMYVDVICDGDYLTRYFYVNASRLRLFDDERGKRKKLPKRTSGIANYTRSSLSPEIIEHAAFIHPREPSMLFPELINWNCGDMDYVDCSNTILPLK